MIFKQIPRILRAAQIMCRYHPVVAHQVLTHTIITHALPHFLVHVDLESPDSNSNQHSALDEKNLLELRNLISKLLFKDKPANDSVASTLGTPILSLIARLSLLILLAQDSH